MADFLSQAHEIIQIVVGEEEELADLAEALEVADLVNSTEDYK